VDKSETWRPRSRDDIVFRKTGDEWSLYDPVGDDLHVVNPTAALVWTLCTGELTPAEIRSELAHALDGDDGDDDVGEILEWFQAAELFAS